MQSLERKEPRRHPQKRRTAAVLRTPYSVLPTQYTCLWRVFSSGDGAFAHATSSSQGSANRPAVARSSRSCFPLLLPFPSRPSTQSNDVVPCLFIRSLYPSLLAFSSPPSSCTFPCSSTQNILLSFRTIQ